MSEPKNPAEDTKATQPEEGELTDDALEQVSGGTNVAAPLASHKVVGVVSYKEAPNNFLKIDAGQIKQ
jgi:hypothetical protein